MKVLVLGDTHVHNHPAFGGPKVRGINTRCREILDAIRLNVLAARDQLGIECVVQLGDFFDTGRPPPPVVDAAMAVIEETHLPWHILAGNHDILSFGAPTAIAPLGHLPQVRIYEKVELALLPGGYRWLMVPYISANADVALRAVHTCLGEERADLAFIHYAMIGNSSRTDVWPKDATAVTTGCTFFGHEHNLVTTQSRPRIGVGSFCDFGFGNNALHHMAVVDASTGYGTLRPVVGPWFMDAHLTDGPPDFLDIVQTFSGWRASGATSIYLRDTKARDIHKALVKAGFARAIHVVPKDAESAEDMEDARTELVSFSDLLQEEIHRITSDPLVRERVTRLCKEHAQS